MHRLILAALSCMSLVRYCVAVEVGYKFSGTVTTQFSPPFGKSMQPPTPVVGKFIYETDTAATHPLSGCGDCTGYEQRLVNGFEASFGNTIVRADDYLVLVSNDSPVNPLNPEQGVHDVFTVEFLSNLNPSLSDPLVVDGGNQTTGRFSVSLAGDSTVFPDSSLPNDLDPASFPIMERTGVLSQNPSGVPNVLFSVTSLTSYNVLFGDYNLDEVVDQTDYVAWKAAFGSSTQLNADGNRSKIVDAADYTVWRNNLGVGGSPYARAVPEPSTTVILLSFVATAGLTLFKRLGF